MPPAIPGLRYISDYLDSEGHDRLVSAANARGWQVMGGRGVQIYGYSYHHAKGGIYKVDDLPDWVADLAERLCRDGLMPYRPDQMVANEYPSGSGIFSHVDAPVFDDTIVAVSLGSACVMQFTECDSGRVEESSSSREARSCFPAPCARNGSMASLRGCRMCGWTGLSSEAPEYR